jgi:hypothetical protein
VSLWIFFQSLLDKAVAKTPYLCPVVGRAYSWKMLFGKGHFSVVKGLGKPEIKGEVPMKIDPTVLGLS